MPSNYDLVVVNSVENLGFPIGSIKERLAVSDWVRWAQFERWFDRL